MRLSCLLLLGASMVVCGCGGSVTNADGGGTDASLDASDASTAMDGMTDVATTIDASASDPGNVTCGGQRRASR